MKEFIKSFLTKEVFHSTITMFIVFMVMACIGEMTWGGPKFEDYFFFWKEAGPYNDVVGILHQKPISVAHQIYLYFVFLLGPIVSLIRYGVKTTARALVFSVYSYIFAIVMMCLIVLFALLFTRKKK